MSSGLQVCKLLYVSFNFTRSFPTSNYVSIDRAGGGMQILHFINCKHIMLYIGGIAREFFGFYFLCVFTWLTWNSWISMNIMTIGVWPASVRNMSLHPLQNHIEYEVKADFQISRELSGGHSTIFYKYMKICNIMIMSFWGFLDAICCITRGFTSFFTTPKWCFIWTMLQKRTRQNPCEREFAV